MVKISPLENESSLLFCRPVTFLRATTFRFRSEIWSRNIDLELYSGILSKYQFIIDIRLTSPSITHSLDAFSHSSHASGGVSDLSVEPSLHNPIQSSGTPFSLQHVLLKVRWPVLVNFNEIKCLIVNKPELR